MPQLHLRKERKMMAPDRKRKRVALLAISIPATLATKVASGHAHHRRRFYPDAAATCICTGPTATAATYHRARGASAPGHLRASTDGSGRVRLPRFHAAETAD